MKVLQSRYFTKILSQNDSDNTYSWTAWMPRRDPIILFNKEKNVPLASLHFEAQSTFDQNDEMGNRGRSLITARPDKDLEEEGIQHFQGLINKDNQEFQLVITNLLEEGYINFNILKMDKGVDTANPGGLNEINELRPFESYAIKCDQSDNCSLILNSLTDNDGMKVTVKGDEKKAKESGNKEKGTYYFLSVVPQNNMKNTELFKETEWKSVDYFFTKSEIVNHNLNRRHFINITRPIGVNTIGPWTDSHIEPDIDYEVEELEEEESVNNSIGMFFGDSDSSDEFKQEILSDHATTQRTKSFMRRSVMEESATVQNNIKKKKSIKKLSTKEKSDMQKVVDLSMATQVGKGKKVEVNSVQTNIEYKYEYNSAPCKLGLSISSNLEISEYKVDEETRKEVKELLVKMIEGKYEEFITNDTLYATDTCIISMDENDKPDTVFYACGHLCVNHKSIEGQRLDKCPLCRKRITSKLLIKEENNKKTLQQVIRN